MKGIIYIACIFFFTFSFSQQDWRSGKIVLKNGDTLKGLVKIPIASGNLISFSKNKVEFRKSQKGRKDKYGSTEVDKVFFSTSSNSSIGYHEYVPLSENKKVLMKLIENGRVKLYVRNIKIKEGNLPIFSNSQNSSIYYGEKNEKQYYIIRDIEYKATRIFEKSNSLLISYNSDLQKFKRQMKNYFSDCSYVISYIDDDLYNDFDFREIIEDYNLLCE